ncbi:MAG: hypothetical protein ACRD30_10445 [Bryobacteraceae bacterium]
MEHDRIDFKSRKDYVYRQQEETREFDDRGAVKKKKGETDEILILVGRPYEMVIARDGEALPPKEAAREREKMDRELARREHLTPEEKTKDDKELIEEREILRQVPEAFDFSILGEERVSGKPVWVIGAEPKPGFQPQGSRAKFLTRVRAMLWIV